MLIFDALVATETLDREPYRDAKRRSR